MTATTAPRLQVDNGYRHYPCGTTEQGEKLFQTKMIEGFCFRAKRKSAESSTNTLCQNGVKPPKLRKAKAPILKTSTLARPRRHKNSEVEKIPKFKAMPFNKKIFESKGSLGVFSVQKYHVTKPVKFHFATDERNRQPNCCYDITSKLSLNLNSAPTNDQAKAKIKTPHPFSVKQLSSKSKQGNKEFITEIGMLSNAVITR